MRNYAADFLRAAKEFRAPPNRFSPVPHYLVCHSIELSLKSFLITVGFSRKDRRQLGHDLAKALNKAEQHGIEEYVGITPDDRDLLQKANTIYMKKELEYFESLETIYDPLNFSHSSTVAFAEKLYEGINGPVSASVFS